MEAVQIASFLAICAVLVVIVVSILCRTTPQQKPTKQPENTLPILPIIDSRYQIQPVNQYPVNGYQQPVNYQPIQQAAPQLDAFTVNYMLQLIANQRRDNG